MENKTSGERFVNKTGDAKKVNRLTNPFGTKRVQKKKTKVSTPKLRSSIKPGSILIVVAGRFAGTRVVFLKQLTSGLLLVTGPYKLNGCPIRRINQAYVIATSTRINISKVEIPSHIDDKYFARVMTKPEAKTKEEKFLAKQNKASVIDEAYMAKRKEDQKAVDTAIIGAIGEDKMLFGYLRAKFSLSKHEYPHKMRF